MSEKGSLGFNNPNYKPENFDINNSLESGEKTAIEIISEKASEIHTKIYKDAQIPDFFVS